MLADALTKPMIAPQMMEFLSSGHLFMKNEPKHVVLLRRLPTLEDLREEDLWKSDDQIAKEVHQGSKMAKLACLTSFKLKPWIATLAMTSLMMTTVSAQGQNEPPRPNESGTARTAPGSETPVEFENPSLKSLFVMTPFHDRRALLSWFKSPSYRLNEW